MEPQLPDVIDRLNTITQLESIKKCIITDSYMDTTDKILILSNTNRLNQTNMSNTSNNGSIGNNVTDINGNEIYIENEYHEDITSDHNHNPNYNPNTLQMPLTNLACVQRVVFIRHGQRYDEIHPNWAEVTDRPQDTPMTEMGLLQSTYTGNWINSQEWVNNIRSVYASPFYRTVRTAHLVLNSISMKQHRPQTPSNNSTKPDWLGNGSGSGSGSGTGLSRSPMNNTTHSHTHTNSAESDLQLHINIENGLCDEADWMAVNARPTKPWYLKPGDLFNCSPNVNLHYKSIKNPIFVDGEEYPGRPVEKEEIYDRCAVTVWRLVRGMGNNNNTNNTNSYSSTNGGGTGFGTPTDPTTIATATPTIMNMIHALCGVGIGLRSGSGLGSGLEHTCITSCIFDPHTGQYIIERGENGQELLCSVQHLPDHIRS